MADASDYIFELESGQKVNFRGARGNDLPWLLQPYWARREDGAIALGLVTGNPADIRSRTTGAEVDPDLVLLIPPEAARDLAERLGRFLDELP